MGIRIFGRKSASLVLERTGRTKGAAASLRKDSGLMAVGYKLPVPTAPHPLEWRHCDPTALGRKSLEELNAFFSIANDACMHVCCLFFFVSFVCVCAVSVRLPL